MNIFPSHPLDNVKTSDFVKPVPRRKKAVSGINLIQLIVTQVKHIVTHFYFQNPDLSEAAALQQYITVGANIIDGFKKKQKHLEQLIDKSEAHNKFLKTLKSC